MFLIEDVLPSINVIDVIGNHMRNRSLWAYGHIWTPSLALSAALCGLPTVNQGQDTAKGRRRLTAPYAP